MDATVTPRKLTNAEVATRLGVHHSYVSRLRSGDRLPSVSMLRAISHEFGIPAGELVDAATRATHGNPTSWVHLIDVAFVAADGADGAEADEAGEAGAE